MTTMGAVAGVFAFVGAVGCGGDDSSSTCASPEGLYVYHVTDSQSVDPTDCPIPTDSEVVLPETNSGNSCSVTGISNGSCSGSVQEDCNVVINGYAGTADEIVTVDSNTDGTAITGHVAETISYGQDGSCNSSWDFSLTRTHQ
jgi:hypothetical protein